MFRELVREISWLSATRRSPTRATRRSACRHRSRMTDGPELADASASSRSCAPASAWSTPCSS